jgi:hypothetical protein
VVCPNNHEQTVSFTQQKFEEALKSDTLVFHCNTCEANWPRREFSKAIRLGLISLESLNDLEGVDGCKVSALAESFRQAHDAATEYMVSLIRPSSRK